MAMDNELNQLLNTTVPSLVNAAIARKDRKEELEYARKYRDERNEILDARYAQEQKQNEDRYNASMAMEREGIEIDKYSTIANRILKTIDKESGINEINKAIKLVQDNFEKSENDFIAADSSVVLEELNEIKGIAKERDKQIGIINNIMQKSISIDGEMRDSFTDQETFAGIMKDIGNAIDFSTRKGIDYITRNANILKEEMKMKRAVREFLLNKELQHGNVEEVTFKDGFDLSNEWVNENKDVAVLLRHIDNLDKAGDTEGAYKQMQFVAKNINDNRQLLKSAANKIQDEMSKEYVSDIKTHLNNAGVYKSKSAGNIYSYSTPKQIKTAIGQNIFTLSKEAIKEKAPSQIKEFMEQIEKVKNPAKQNSMYRDFGDMLVAWKNSENSEQLQKVFDWDKSWANPMSWISAGWDSKKANAFLSLLNAFEISREYNEFSGGKNNSYIERLKDDNGNMLFKPQDSDLLKPTEEDKNYMKRRINNTTTIREEALPTEEEMSNLYDRL